VSVNVSFSCNFLLLSLYIYIYENVPTYSLVGPFFLYVGCLLYLRWVRIRVVCPVYVGHILCLDYLFLLTVCVFIPVFKVSPCLLYVT
jgi:hypothetical protein